MKFVNYLTIAIIIFIPTTRASIQCFENSQSPSDFCEEVLDCVIDLSPDEDDSISSDIRDCKCQLKIDRYDDTSPLLTVHTARELCNDRRELLSELVIVGGDYRKFDTEILHVYPNLSRISITENEFDMSCLRHVGMPQITHLDLSHNKITKVLSEVLANMRSLVVFNSSHNSIKSTDNSFQYLRYLQEVYLNNNHLTVIAIKDFFDLPKLRILDLSHNFLFEINSDLNLPILEILDLSFNNLSQLNSLGNGNLPNLHTISIAVNNFRGFAGNFNFNKLQKLNANDNKFTSLDEDLLKPSMTNLESVDLSNNKIKTIEGKQFNYPKMQKLYLGNNLLDDEGILCENLPELANLNVIDLSENQLRTIKNCYLKNMTNLLDIRMNSNLIDHIEPNSFVNQQKLEKLQLSGNKIHKIYKRDLKGLSNLQKLDLANNDIEMIEKGAFDDLPSTTRVLVVVKNGDKNCAFDNAKVDPEVYNLCLNKNNASNTSIIYIGLGCLLVVLVAIIAITVCVMVKFCCKKKKPIQIQMSPKV